MMNCSLPASSTAPDRPDPGRKKLRLKARAKINLYLKAIGRREDGFTEIFTVFQTISLADGISLIKTPESIDAVCDHPGVPEGEKNLAYRAADLFFRCSGISGGVKIFIDKKIPVAAGLGGGSSDAAAVLKGLNALYGTDLGENEMMSMAAELGSDVPFFLIGGTAIGKGRGEVIEAMPDLKPVPLVVVFPDKSINAEEAYKLLPVVLTGNTADISIIMQGLATKDIFESVPFLVNDLQKEMLKKHPEIREVLEGLKESGAETAMMTGSGSACYGLFRKRKQAENACRILSRERNWKVFAESFSLR